jgi:hypothetical protein
MRSKETPSPHFRSRRRGAVQAASVHSTLLGCSSTPEGAVWPSTARWLLRQDSGSVGTLAGPAQVTRSASAFGLALSASMPHPTSCQSAIRAGRDRERIVDNAARHENWRKGGALPGVRTRRNEAGATARPRQRRRRCPPKSVVPGGPERRFAATAGVRRTIRAVTLRSVRDQPGLGGPD